MDTPPGPEPLDTDDDLITLWGLVIEGFGATVRRLQDLSEADGGTPVGVSVGDLDVLLRLLRTPGHRLASAVLARESSMTSGGLTRLVDRLVRDGLVRRVDCPTDRRVVWVEATGSGLELAARVRTSHAAWIRRDVVDVLGPDRAAALGSAMRTLRDTHRA